MNADNASILFYTVLNNDEFYYSCVITMDVKMSDNGIYVEIQTGIPTKNVPLISIFLEIFLGTNIKELT